jgi:DNA modification methylase
VVDRFFGGEGRVLALVADAEAALRALPAGSVQCVVTSPPYFGLRDYGVAGQIGLEDTPEAYVARLVAVFREVRRVLRDDGVLWLNIGDSYASSGAAARGGYDGGILASAGRERLAGTRGRCRVAGKGAAKHKDLVGVPWMLAFALRADGWYWRSWMPWIKRNVMPESVKDRPTGGAGCEVIHLFTKSQRYFYDAAAVQRPVAAASVERISQPTFNAQTGGAKDYAHGVNANRSMRKTLENFAANPSRSWRNSDPFFDQLRALAAGGEGLLHGEDGDPLAHVVNPRPFKGAHFAVFPSQLVEPLIKAGSREGDVVLDPFGGAGTTAATAIRLGRRAVHVELNPDYADLSTARIRAALGGAA